MKMKRFSKRALLVNTFGTFGYIFSIFAWAWVGILYLPKLLENKTVSDFLLPTNNHETTYVPPAFESSPLVTFGALAITLVIMIVTVVLLIRIPVTIARTGKKLTTKAADTVVPLAVRNHPVSVAEKRKLTVRFIKLIKLLIVILPVCLQAIGFFFKPPIALDIALFVSSILALLGLLSFSLQYGLVRLLDIDPKRIV